jgi:hypothetical protein
MVGSGEAAVGLGGGTSLAEGDGVAGSVGSGDGSVGVGSVGDGSVGVVGGGSLGAEVVGGAVEGAVVVGLVGTAAGLPPTPAWTTQAAPGWFAVLDAALGAGVGLGASEVEVGITSEGWTRGATTRGPGAAASGVGSAPAPAAASAMARPEPETAVAKRMRKASRRPGSSRRWERITRPPEGRWVYAAGAVELASRTRHNLG